MSDEAFAYDAQILKAALNAIEQTLPVEFNIQNSGNAETGSDWVFWLSNEEMPASDSVNFVVLKSHKASMLISHEKSNQWTINKRLTVDVARNENLSLQLAELLLADSKLTARLNQHDSRVLPDSVILSGNKKEGFVLKAGVLASSPNKFILMLFLLVLMSERIIAYARKQ